MEKDRDNLTLSPPDAAAMDAVLNNEAAPAGASADEHQQRRARVEGWLAVVGTAPVPEMRGDLAARTLAAVQADRMVLPQPTRSSLPVGGGAVETEVEESRSIYWARWRRRAAVIGSMAVAASLLLFVSIEGMGAVRRSQARTACAGNMQHFATAFTAYSSSFGGELPMIAMPNNQNWLYGNTETGARNNAAHLLPLVVGNYMPLNSFYCPGAATPETGAMKTGHNEMPSIGYSYRNLYGPEKPRWDSMHSTIVLTDKNPVFALTAHAGTENNNSANHDGHGSYVLRADSAVTWEVSPNIGPDHDNIWTLGKGKDRQIVYKGLEVPANNSDVFVCP